MTWEKKGKRSRDIGGKKEEEKEDKVT